MAENNNPANWFEIPATDLQRAKDFYADVFGFEFQSMAMGKLKMEMFPGEENAPGVSGALVQAETYVPSYDGSMVYFSVDDIEATLDKVAQKGGKVLNPKSSIGEFGFVGHFEDSEGNRVALHSDQ